MAGSSRIDELVADSSAQIRERVGVFCEHWQEMYTINDHFLKKYCSRIKLHITGLLNDIEEDIKNKKSHLAAHVEECVNEKNKLERELGKTVRTPAFPDGTPLQEMIAVLERQLKEYSDEKAERLVVVDKLKEEQLMLCNLLDEPPYQLAAELPSAEELENLKFRVLELQHLKDQRREELRPIQIRMRELMTILEQEPSNELEKALIRNDVESLPITTSRMVEAQESLKRKEQELKLAEEQMIHLKNEIVRLWDRIDVPQAYRTQFLDMNPGIGNSSKDAFFQEKERCEVIKRATIQPIIERLRKDIAGLWNVLTFTDEQRCGFSAYHTDVLNEDVLDLHELEFSRLEQLYNQNKSLLDLAAERQKVRDQYERLEEMSRNPNRLKNRGGTLLVEEKERKTLLKNLLKVESKLKAALVSFYEVHDTPFLWWGEDLLQKITQDEQEHPSRTTPRKKPVPTARKENVMSRSSSKSSFTTLSSESVASYSQFQEQIELGASIGRPSRNTPLRYTPRSTTAKRLCTPVTRSASSRLPLRQIQPSPYSARAHSSPTTPSRRALSKPSPRRATPRRFGISAAKTSLHF